VSEIGPTADTQPAVESVVADEVDGVPAVGERLVAGANDKKTPAPAGVRKHFVILAGDPRCRTLEDVIWIGLDYPNLLLGL